MNRSERERRRHASDNGHRTRNTDKRFAGDYYYNYNQPAWTERDEEWYRHTYGLPASGRMGQRRHDIAEWGNPSFTQNRTSKQYDRINENHRDFQNEREQNAADRYDYDRDNDRSWNRRGDESYNWGENSHPYNQHTSHYSSDLARHRGKGPKGFIRSDERIREDINSRLTDDAYVDASDIDVTVEKGEVTLTGTVPDRSSKRRAEDISELVSGVTNVENRLRVK